MPQSLAHIALIVRDYDEAIAGFTGKLGFTHVADEHKPEQDKRRVLVAPPGAGDDAASLLLARAATPELAAFTPVDTALSYTTTFMVQIVDGMPTPIHPRPARFP